MFQHLAPMEDLQILGIFKHIGPLEGFSFFGLLIIAIIVIIPFWRIFKRAGYPGAFGLLAIIPFAGIVLLYVLAFMPWPNLKGMEGE